MNNTSVFLLLLAGIGVTAVVMFLVFKPPVYGSYRVVAPPKVAYNNEETWSFKKDKDGRVTGVTVHRKATEG